MKDLQSKYSEAYKILETANEHVLSCLAGTPLHLQISHQLKKPLNRLAGLSKNKMRLETQSTHTPITKFMGEEITHRQVDVNVELGMDEVDVLRNRALVYKKEFLTLATEAILERAQSASDILVLRALAKLVGVEDYDTHEINVKFVGKIRKSIQAETKAASQEEEIDRKLKADVAVTESKVLAESTGAADNSEEGNDIGEGDDSDESDDNGEEGGAINSAEESEFDLDKALEEDQLSETKQAKKKNTKK